MKIKELSDEYILFDNGSTITYSHLQSCYEMNYADFNQLDDIARNTVFQEPILFESVNGSGFKLGNPGRMFFVPCYSEQNGYYTSEIDIYYNKQRVLTFDCEGKFYF